VAHYDFIIFSLSELKKLQRIKLTFNIFPDTRNYVAGRYDVKLLIVFLIFGLQAYVYVVGNFVAIRSGASRCPHGYDFKNRWLSIRLRRSRTVLIFFGLSSALGRTLTRNQVLKQSSGRAGPRNNRARRTDHNDVGTFVFNENRTVLRAPLLRYVFHGKTRTGLGEVRPRPGSRPTRRPITDWARRTRPPPPNRPDRSP